jgi:hypothetical protein
MRACKRIPQCSKEIISLKMSPEIRINEINKEIGVFEEEEQREIHAHAQRHEKLLPPNGFCIVNGIANIKVVKRGEHQQEKIKTTAFIVKE